MAKSNILENGFQIIILGLLLLTLFPILAVKLFESLLIGILVGVILAVIIIVVYLFLKYKDEGSFV